jgi:cytochrome P450
MGASAPHYRPGIRQRAAALAWTLYLVALYPEWQDRAAAEAQAVIDPEKIYFSTGSRLRQARAIFREAMRLYPPVPMYLREAARKAYVPFSAGQRVCPGSAFAMIEAPLILAMILRNYHLTPPPTAGRCRWRN